MVLVIVALFVFMPCTVNDFVDWDDYGFVTENPHIGRLSYESMLWMLTSFYQGVWHPLTWLSHALDRSLWGLNPSAHHLVSVVLHAVNGALVFVVCLMLQDAWNERNPRRRSIPETTRIVAAFTAGLLFVIHPLRVDSVTWISGRKDLLCALFFLAAIVSYLNYVRSNKASRLRRGVCYACALAFHGAAILSKPMAVTLPFVLLLLDYYPLYRMRRSVLWQCVEGKVPFFALSGVATVMNMAAKWGEAIPFSYVPAYVRVMNAFHSVVTYIVQTVAPITLSPLYPMDLTVNYSGPSYVAAAMLVTGVTVSCLYLAMRDRRLLLGVWLYYLITLAPVLGLFMSYRHATADRYTYLPTLGFYLLVGLSVGRLWEIADRLHRASFTRMLLGVSVLAVVLVYVIKAQEQIAVWRTTETLWSHVLMHARPVPDIAYFALGKVYENKGDFDQALGFYREALSLNPTNTCFKGKIATVLARSGKTAEARTLALQLIETDPRNPDAYVTLGRIEGLLGRFDEAVRAQEQALRLQPQYPPALGLLMMAYLKKNELGRARHYYEIYTGKGFSVPQEIQSKLMPEAD